MTSTRLPFDVVFADESGGNIKTPQSEYLPKGILPVVDQGKALIGGYVDDPSRLCGEGRPAIIFGDHTRCIKYVDFPFCMGADGVKVLRPKIEADLKYLYYFLRTLKLPDAGYDRHFKYLKRTEVVLPPLPEQRRIVAILDQADALRAKRREALTQLDRLAQSIFIDMFGDSRPDTVGNNGVKLSTLIEINPSITKQERHGLVGKRVTFLPMASIGDLDKRILSVETRHYHEVSKGYTPFKRGDLLVAKITPCYENGKMAIVEGIPTEWGFGSTEFHVFRSGSSSFELFLFYLFQLAWLKKAGANSMRGAAGQKRVAAEFFGDLCVIPPDHKKLEIFAKRIAAVGLAKTRSHDSLTRLEILFKSIQSRAFRGEL